VTLYKLEDVRVNTDLPPEKLDLRFPAGARVVDEIAGIQYRVDDPSGDLQALDAVPMPYGAA
jgi:hypothetical protein